MWDKQKNVERSLLAIILLGVSVFFIIKFRITSDYKNDFYKQNQHIISFNTQSEIKLESLSLITNEKINLPELEREDYTFNGWVDENNKPISNPYVVSKDEIVTATWTKNDFKSYAVAFDLNGGYGTYATLSVKEGLNAVKPKDPTRSGYYFSGWYLNGKKYTFTEPVNKNIVLVAGWKADPNYTFTISLHYNDGTGRVDKQVSKVNGYVKEPEKPKKEGYSFKGWYLNGKKYDFNTRVTDNITLSAYWQKGTNNSYYAVVFDLNGGIGEVKNQLVTAGKLVKKPSTPTRSGYTFLGWYNGSKKYDFNTKVNSSLELVAKWKMNSASTKYYTVTFNTDSSESKIANQKVVVGTSATPPITPKKTGYKFLGWYNGNQKYNFNTILKSNITLTAKWEKYSTTKSYDVKFDTAGGKTTVSSQSINEGAAIPIPQTPVREGYRFVGWYIDNEEYDFREPVTEGKTLVAVWEKEEVYYTVSFDANGSKTSVASQVILENESVKKPTNPKRSGYTFKGWYRNNEKYDFSTPVHSNFILTAKWIKSVETTTYRIVIFNANGGKLNGPTSISIPNGETIEEPNDPVKTGFKFDGWYFNQREFDFDTRITSNIILNAAWVLDGSINDKDNTCVATEPKSNVIGSGVQVHCLKQTCVNGELQTDTLSGNNAVKCAEGYMKTTKKKSSTCKESISQKECTSTFKFYCTQEWEYTCTKKD